MRILFTIPHYYNASGGGAYGSLKPDPKPRRRALASTVLALHCTFGNRQGLMGRPVTQGNTSHAAAIEVAVCTTGSHHLIDSLGLPQDCYRHQVTGAKAMFLGYECHALLKAGLGSYDYYCYLEDDLLVTDPLFFQKLAWFNTLAGDDAVLQPNRFEIAVGQSWHKLYIDGNLAQPEISMRLQDVTDRTVVAGEAFGAEVRFQRVNNPHSGCFFLNARQMERWAAQPDFLKHDAAFAGPLESAATLGVMRHFRAYKPARENAGFLEVRHLHNRYLGARLRAPAPQRRQAKT